MVSNAHKSLLQTLVCVIFVGLGFLVDAIGQSSFSSVLFIMAFIVGGYASAKEGLLELFQEKHLTVDVLMVLAALGAGLIGYWMEGALLIVIFSLSATLEAFALAKTTQAMASLLALTPNDARKIQPSGEIVIVATADLQIGDRVQVLKGQSVPTDGTLCQGFALLDESMISGEPLPVEKTEGDMVIGGTINQGETFEMQVSVASGETMFAKIVSLVKQAESRQSKTATLIDRLEDSYVKGVLLLVPLFIAVTYLVLGWELEVAFYRGMILLTVASPCALVASATPASLSALSQAAKMGVIIKGGDTASSLAEIKAIVFDKTGTLTQGRPTVSDVCVLPQAKPYLGSIVKTAERQSSHPIAQALLAYHEADNWLEVSAISDVTGRGLSLSYDGDVWRIGKQAFCLEDRAISPLAKTFVTEKEDAGQTVIYVTCNETLQGVYALADHVRPEAATLVQDLKAMGLRTMMLTGDQEKTARVIAEMLDLDGFVANCLPEDKAAHIKSFQETYGVVGMVGDGINDAPALATADVGFAVSSGTDIAMESADVVLVDDLTRLPFALQLSRKLRVITLENIIFALLVIGSLMVSNLSQGINLPQGVIGHEGSTILVILNGLRLLRFKG